MDTSKQYIEMCDCPEIQGQVNLIPLMLTGAPTDNNGIALGVRNLDIIGGVWLPHQDQLQEMITADLYGWKRINAKDRLEFFYCFVNDITPRWLLIETSMEQLWLAFVMKEKHDKVWDGKWVDRV